MRIVINGQQAFGASVLEALVESGEDVVAVYGAPDKPDRPPDPLAEAAREAGIPLRQPDSFEAEDTAAALAALRPDLMVMAFVTLFVPEPVLNTPTHGSIQYHPSLLPRHRGPSAVNWAIIQGDPKTGIAIFWPDEGLDTGPVLMLKEVEVAPDDTLGSLYFDKLFPLGVEAMVESVDLVREGRAPSSSRTRQRPRTRVGAAKPTSRSTGRGRSPTSTTSSAARTRGRARGRRSAPSRSRSSTASASTATRACPRGRSSKSAATGSWWPRAAAQSRSGSYARTARRRPPANTRAPRVSSRARASAAASVRPGSRNP